MKKGFNKIGTWIMGIVLGIAFLLSLFSSDLSQRWLHWSFEKFTSAIEWVIGNRVERATNKLEKMSENLQEQNKTEEPPSQEQ